MEWFFDGLGTELIVLVIGIASGGVMGYRIGIKKSVHQKQNAKDNATQIQIGGNYHEK